MSNEPLERTFVKTNDDSGKSSVFKSSTVGFEDNRRHCLDEQHEDSFTICLSTELQNDGNALDEVEPVPVEEVDLNQDSDDGVASQEAKQTEEMLDAVLGFTEDCNSNVLKMTEEVKKQTDVVESVTRDVIQERDQAMIDLHNVEQAFSDVYRKYERAKLMLENAKVNEDVLKQNNHKLQYILDSMDEQNDTFKQEERQKMEKIFKDSQTKLDALESENSKLLVQHRRGEMRVETLESELKCKQRENVQLSKLADELIGKSASGTI